MKVTEEELLTFSAELLAEYNIPLEFEKDGIYLQESIERVCKKLNIHAVSNRREQLIAYSKWLANEIDECNFLDEINVDHYLKAINCC